MAFKRSAVRSRLSPPTTDRKANALRSCSIYGSDTPPRFPQQLNQVHNWRLFSIRRWALFYFINDGGKIDRNDHSKDSQTRYLREAAIVLAKEGFQSDEIHADRLCIQLDGSPLCEVTESGGVAYRNENIDEPERIAAKDKVYEIVKTTAEYMRQMETAPFLKADGLEDGYKVLADFNGTVLAGVQSKHGVHFVTWDWAYGHTGVCHGHYFMENYAGAKQDFAIRSGLIQKERLFTPEQMTEIYRCCADSVDGDFFELTGEQEKMIRSVQQQIEECVPDLDERIRQQKEALEQVAQQQTM